MTTVITQAHHDHLAFINATTTPGQKLPLCGCELCDDWLAALEAAGRGLPVTIEEVAEEVLRIHSYDDPRRGAAIERIVDAVAFESMTPQELRALLVRELERYCDG